MRSPTMGLMIGSLARLGSIVLLMCPLAAQGNASGPAAAQSSSREKKLDSASRRNENVPVYQLDTNALQELNKRLGTTVTAVPEAVVELNHYGAEFGRPPQGSFLLTKSSPAASWHGELFESHQNSILNARTFFQVGKVQPSRQNLYGARAGGPAGLLGHLSGAFSQQKIRGMVNGNILVPLASERVPLAQDPGLRDRIQLFLGAFPEALPNRLDFDRRALNTNAPQSIDSSSADLRLDRPLSGRVQLSLFHSLQREHIDAFQFVAGQNPDTEIHSHRSRISLRSELSPASLLELGATFQRVRSALHPEPGSVGPRVRFGFQIQELGPDSQFPVNRAQNVFSYGSVLTHRRGNHAWTLGGSLGHTQLNGVESNNLRGYFQFTSAFGRTAIQNFLTGTPSKYEVTVGQVQRGFRNWRTDLFAGDRWSLSPRFQLYYGVRYSLETAPREVNGLDQVPYGCDCNNWSPRLSLAYSPDRRWVARAGYSVSYGQIFPVTYQQIRNNPPLVRQIQVQNPSLLNPLEGIDLSNPDTRYSPLLISPELTSPYAHQYSLSLERKMAAGLRIRAGYLGSRTIKLLNSEVSNRAEIVPGIPHTLETVDLRRRDPRFYEVLTILNSGIAYLDAGQLEVEGQSQDRFYWRATYTFSKAIDTGADFASTAANRDLSSGRSQYQDDTFGDKKSLSSFDSPHSLLMFFSAELPGLQGESWTGALTRGWQLTGAGVLKAGTPLTLYIGSDSPGFGNVDGGPSERPNLLNRAILGRTIGHPDSAPSILRREYFAFIRPGERRGDLGRNTFRKAPISNLNLALNRRWVLHSPAEWTLHFRAEVYNVSNTPQFDEPQRNLSSPAFGTITNSLNEGRTIQLGLRLAF